MTSSPGPIGKSTCAPRDRPIQLRCISLTGSGQSSDVQVLDQPVAVRGDPHHPLLQVALEDRVVAALAAAVRGDLLVGQHGAQPRAPVDRRLADVRQAEVVDHLAGARPRTAPPRTGRPGCAAVAGLELGDQLVDRAGLAQVRVEPGVEHLQEDPLGPPVVLRVGGGEACGGCRRPGPAGAAARGTARRWPRWWSAGGCRSAPRTARRAGRTRRSPSGAARCSRPSACSGCSSRCRCSPAGARRAGRRRTGTGTCPARAASGAPARGWPGSASSPSGLGA